MKTKKWRAALRRLLVALGRLANLQFDAQVKAKWEFECYDRFGNLKWQDGFENLVVTVGRNKLLDATFKTGLASPAWYVGLKDTGTPAAGDTMGSHATWPTITPYSDATDPGFTPGTIAAGSVDNDASKATFNINATDDVYGAFLKDDNTKGGTTGTLYGAGDFSSARSVEDGDTLNVKITLSITAS
jgi:hypothetical protein